MFFGNVSCKLDETNFYKVTIHVYNKLTDKMTISDIDNFTMYFNNEKELIKYFSDKTKTKKEFTPDINIMYFEDKNCNEKETKDLDKRIKYLPILYKEDKEKINEWYIESCFREEIDRENIYFFERLIEDFSFNPIVKKHISSMNHYIELAKSHSGKENNRVTKIYYECLACMLHSARNLFETLIKVRDSKKRPIEGKINHRLLRDFYIFTQEYDIPYELKKLPTKYNPRLSQEQRKSMEEYTELKLKR